MLKEKSWQQVLFNLMVHLKQKENRTTINWIYKKIRMIKYLAVLLLFFFLISCTQQKKYDTIIRNGMIYDGNGGEPYKADIGINADTVAFIGDLKNATAKDVIDGTGMAIAPGFINML